MRRIEFFYQVYLGKSNKYSHDGQAFQEKYKFSSYLISFTDKPAIKNRTSHTPIGDIIRETILNASTIYGKTEEAWCTFFAVYTELAQYDYAVYALQALQNQQMVFKFQPATRKSGASMSGAFLTWWQWLLQFLCFFSVLDDQCVEVLAASHFELNIFLILFDLNS